MRIRITILVIVVGVIMILTQPAIADDLADLKAAHQMYDKAWTLAMWLAPLRFGKMEEYGFRPCTPFL